MKDLIFPNDADSYFPSTSVFSISFSVKGFGYIQNEVIQYPYIFKRKDLDSLHFVLSGSGYIESNGKIYKVKKGDFFLLKNNSNTLFYQSQNDPWVCIWIDFSYHKQIENFYSLLNLKGNIGKFVNQNELVDCVQFLLSNKEKFDSLYINAKLLETIYSVALKHKEKNKEIVKTKPNSNEIANLVLLYIDNNFRNSDLTIKSISEKFSYTNEHLTRIFKKQYGVNLKQYLLQVRMEEAEALLLSKTPVTKVAEMCGFNSASNFSKCFKKYFGKNPKACYKEKVINK